MGGDLLCAHHASGGPLVSGDGVAMKTFYVYFDQINQTKYEVKAKDSESAIAKAKTLWRAENSAPSGAYVEDDKGNQA